MDVINGIITTITTVIGSGTIIYNLLLRDSRKRKAQYYEELLKPFVVEYKSNLDITMTSFLNNKADCSNDNIPKYVFYLIDKCQKENKIEDKSIDNQEIIKKVLIYDYFDLYSNEYNKKIHIFEVIKKLVTYIMILTSFVFLFSSVWYTSNFMIEFAKERIINNYSNLLFGIKCLFLSVIFALLPDFFYDDMYTTKKHKIEKLINKKVKRYDKVQDKYFL